MFFVTGLPRSRTAWFSLYLDCEHEAMEGLSREEFYSLDIKGDSDCGLFLTDFQDHWDAPTVVIRRPPEAVVSSLKRIGYDMDLTMMQNVDSRLDSIQGLHVPFDQINDRLEEITTYLGVEYDAARAERYKTMKVELVKIKDDLNIFEVWG